VSRLGRFVEHDSRSRDFGADQTAPVQTVLWTRRSPILDQGDLGSCTGHAAAGWLATDTARRPGRKDVTEDLAVEIYSKATHLDRVAGIYPPHDTGSSGLAAAKAMRALGLTTGPYRHAFGLTHALQALQLGPLLVGMTWLTGCDKPETSGLIHYKGTVRGGHEILLRGYDNQTQVLTFDNSWGAGFADKGSFYMTCDDFALALADHGDVTSPS
jgi:hypothetical protein